MLKRETEGEFRLLTPKERLRLTLAKKPVDRPPFICLGGMMNTAIEEVMDLTENKWPEAHSNAELMAGLAAGIYEQGGFENFGVPFCMTVEAEAMGAKVFLGTKINEPRVTSYPLQSMEDWMKLKRINPEEGRVKVVLDAIKILWDKNPQVPLVANLVGPISVATSLIEPTIFYKDMRKNPQIVHKMMTFITENLIFFGKTQLKAGANVLAVSEPSGTGEILGPALFREFSAPYLNKIVGALKDYAEIGTIIHICGRLKSVYRELKDLECDAISVDGITSIKKVVENLPDKIIMGNISTFALEYESPLGIKNMAENCLLNGAKILAPACGIGPRTPLVNIQMALEVAKEHELKGVQR